jgi:protein involved in polysaccharide export with SLBB domain
MAGLKRCCYTSKPKRRPLERITGESLTFCNFRTLLWAWGLCAAFLLCTSAQAQRPEGADPTSPALDTSSAVRLAQPRILPPELTTSATAASAGSPYQSGEFERYVQRLAGEGIVVRRLGAELMAGSMDGRGAEFSPAVPEDYLVAVGDEVLVTLWGTVEADLRLTVDRSGRISIPRVGSVAVAGVRYSELTETVSRRVAQVFRSFQINVSLGQLRPIRVFVTGQVFRPGAYSVSALSTVIGGLLQSGGPAAAGSFREIELRRGGQVISRLDLYDLLVNGNRAADRNLIAGDVIHVGPVGNQVGMIGSVNKAVVAELKSTETVNDLLRFAGGFSAVADQTRLAIERLQERQVGRVSLLELPRDVSQSLGNGDVVRAFSAVNAMLPTQRQSRRVLIEGEVFKPGEYVLRENTSLSDAIRAAGGLTSSAFLPATEFTRESVRLNQQSNYDRVLRDLETSVATNNAAKRVSNAEEAAAVQTSAATSNRLVDRLKQIRPTGRIVLNIYPGDTALPELALEDGDRIFVPPRPSTIGVFGSVFNAGSYLYREGRTLDDYTRLAGGPTKGADEKSMFVVRANGDVVSNRQNKRFFGSADNVRVLKAEPGDTVFVPEELDRTTFIQHAKDWTQVLFQLGIGASGIKAALN